MIDTHTHIYGPEFSLENQPDGSMQGQIETIDRALATGVDIMILPAVDRESISPMKRLNALRPDNTALAMGLHPTEVKDNWREELHHMMSVLNDGSKYVAVGEVGIDLYWDKTFESEQMQVFDAQLAEAKRLGLPVIIHQRNALEPVLEVLSGYPGVEAVFHSFGGSVADVESIRWLGDYYFGINGIVTFKNSGLASVLPAIGLDRILTETDSPYLAPVPYRGRRNESAYIPHIVDRIAESIEIPADNVANTTTENAIKFFRLSQS